MWKLYRGIEEEDRRKGRAREGQRRIFRDEAENDQSTSVDRRLTERLTSMHRVYQSYPSSLRELSSGLSES